MGRSNPVTTSIPYSTSGAIVNVAGSTGALLEQGSTNYNAVIDTIILRISRLIDIYCQRRFYTSTGDETRYFDGPPWRPDPVGVGFGVGMLGYGYGSYGNAGTRRFFSGLPIVSITSLQLANGTNDAASTTYTTIDSRDWYLRPNDLYEDGWPFDIIELSDSPVGTYSTAAYMWFSPGLETVQVTGKFGWNSTGYDSANFPSLIRDVCESESIRYFRARDVGFSDLAGVSELVGPIQAGKMLSAHSRFLLDSYRRFPLP